MAGGIQFGSYREPIFESDPWAKAFAEVSRTTAPVSVFRFDVAAVHLDVA